MDARAVAATITEHSSRALSGGEVVVDGVTVQEAGRRRLVRVLLARDVSGVAAEDTTSGVEPLSLDEVAAATREISDALDSCGAMGERPYTLEVSSAGLDRPLTTADQFRRSVGRLVKVTRTDGSTLTGRLTAAAPDELTVEGEHGTDRLAPTDITKATVQVEFSRPDRKDD